MESEQRIQIGRKWSRAFADLEAFGPPHSFCPRVLAGLYAVASICYHGNDDSPIRDETFDALNEAEQLTLQFAALLPEDNVARIWLHELLNGSDLELPPISIGLVSSTRHPSNSV